VSSEKSIEQRATSLGLHGLLAHLDDVEKEPWVLQFLDWEEEARTTRGLARRISAAHIGRFRPMADFDYAWPKRIDRDAVEDAFRLDFITQADNLVLLGPNGVGKTMLAQNICYQAVLRGIPTLLTTASALLPLSRLTSRLRNGTRYSLTHPRS
jgi:DNA replication protein DnaC